jgi:PAS domain S-box-containing protein
VSRFDVHLTGKERTFGEDEIIVSKTDPKGIITYANPVFMRIAGYEEHELLGRPHNIVRHPHMPRVVFKLLWDTLKGGSEIFAYVLNRSKSGDHYWVFAHVTPTFDERGAIHAYHSSRRKPASTAVAKIAPIYQLLLAEEKKHGQPRDAMAASERLLLSHLEKLGMTYERFVFTL